MIQRNSVPILEFDPNPESLIEPSRLVARRNIPSHCVMLFFRDVLDALKSEGRLVEVASFVCETVELPVYEMEVEGRKLCITQAFLGSAGIAGQLEELIAMGIDKFIVVGGAGVLRKDIAVGHLILPRSAVRDEGVSYHYLPPAREVDCPVESYAILEREMKKTGIPYLSGKTWTTDAFYRETRDKVDLRVEEGCLTVEMESAALFAVATFRNVSLAQILYGGDDVSGEQWDHRSWQGRSEIRRNLCELALKICLEL